MGPSDYFPSMSAADYVAMMSNPSTLGHPLVGTQHFLSFPTFTRTSPDTITGLYQVRAHHVRFSSDAQGGSDGKGGVKGYAKGWGRKVLAVATGHSVIQHFYTRTEEGWKLSGLRPEVGFDQGDLKGLFAVREEGEVVKTACVVGMSGAPCSRTSSPYRCMLGGCVNTLDCCRTAVVDME